VGYVDTKNYPTGRGNRYLPHKKIDPRHWAYSFGNKDYAARNVFFSATDTCTVPESSHFAGFRPRAFLLSSSVGGG